MEILFDEIHGQSTKITDLASILGFEGGIINWHIDYRLPLEDVTAWELTPENLEKSFILRN
ncbi:hypothetical protein JCM21738_5245 [Mesobacillus boroniphilus JCM 21738]|uniref:Uncharacterized protein n=1 Tax=Mesobacillus boroniphilus JCM 21738 TaxID=1294265 RepID=W4RV26_9BACI|nr:hypothetical protein JCM21738_5245 [Mesobacillus boroniphilus JCM 21738]